MRDDVFDLLASFEPRGILLDTNIPVVYIVALVDIRKVGAVKRTEAYESADARFLLQLLPRYAKRYTTPAILGETTDLLLQFFRGLPSGVLHGLKVAIQEELAVTEERHIPAKTLAEDDALLPYGFTDLAIAALGGQQLVVLTSDAALARLLENRELPGVNFNHIRLQLDRT
jgi:hypothetical protein